MVKSRDVKEVTLAGSNSKGMREREDFPVSHLLVGQTVVSLPRTDVTGNATGLGGNGELRLGGVGFEELMDHHGHRLEGGLDSWQRPPLQRTESSLQPGV